MDLINWKNLWCFWLDKSSNLCNYIFSWFTCSSSCFWLNWKNRLKHIECFSLRICNLSIVMKSKGLWRRIKWQFLNVFYVLIYSGCIRLFIDSRSWEFMSNLEASSIQINWNNCSDQTHIFIICDSTSVIDLWA